VIDAGAAVAADSSQHGRAGKAIFAQHFDDSFVEGFPVPFVRFADVDAHQRALAFEFSWVMSEPRDL